MYVIVIIALYMWSKKRSICNYCKSLYCYLHTFIL